MRRGSNNKTKWVHLRLSVAEHKMIMQRQSKSTCRNLSQYLRNVLLDRPVVTTYRNLSQDDLIQQLALTNYELNAIGNNLNQITKRLYTLQLLEERTWASIFSENAEGISIKISEVKELVQKITERWLR